MSDRVRRRRLEASDQFAPQLISSRRAQGGLSPASRIRIAADAHRHSTSDDDSGCALDEYAWVPSGLKPNMVHAYFACLPENKVPFIGSAGEKWRQRQSRYQLPPQDSDVRYCEDLNSEEADTLRMFERTRKTECLGSGVVQYAPFDTKCEKCPKRLEEGEISVMATRTQKRYHPACFRCQTCDVLLVDLIYFAHENQIFCGRHHAEQIKPRCAKCDEVIFGDECLEAEGRSWHFHHFQCAQCNDVLADQKYMQRANKPVCLKCFHSSSSTISCTTCRLSFSSDTPHMSQGDLHWHASAECFCCCVCSKNLLGVKYSRVGESLFCGYQTCGGEDEELLDEDRLGSPHRKTTQKSTRVVRIPASPRVAPRLPHIVQQNQNFMTTTMQIQKPSVINKSQGQRPKPPQRAPPPPPSENIYETVLPCSSQNSPNFDKKYPHDMPTSPSHHNYYSKTPNKLSTGYPEMDGYSTSSSSDSEDEQLYISNIMAAASLSRAPVKNSSRKSKKNEPMMMSGGGVRMAKKKKSSRCTVS
ncbi:hypothetical protein GCK72_013810 [Caenorhabditis remanei]|uniref:Uncharacterized protein n=1 Tax=Caenorhabditis remanei TaxID=31234 RepID=A0A6A5GS41_CAERE|nr:hypothetical protein GCK72_013810 [Caenorhabditis remanei]KAF1757355.1 hypothetical protein GCK72_013810 [Caenorhabditis remanei]